MSRSVRFRCSGGRADISPIPRGENEQDQFFVWRKGKERRTFRPSVTYFPAYHIVVWSFVREITPWSSFYLRRSECVVRDEPPRAAPLLSLVRCGAVSLYKKRVALDVA